MSWMCATRRSSNPATCPVRGTPRDGPAFEYLGCDLWEFRDGRVVKKDTYWKFVA